MSRTGSLLLVILVVLAALQIGQTWQLRREVRALRAQIAQSASQPGASSLKAAGAKLAEAAKAAARGDTRKAEKVAGDAIALLEKSGGREGVNELNQAVKSARAYINQMLKGVYRPAQEKNR